MNTRKNTQRFPQSSQSGFTIIESLVAIIVLTILLVGIAPVLALAVATRVQAKRVEVATRSARSYIDGVRAGNIEPPPITGTKLSDYLPPSRNPSLNCTANTYCTAPTDLYCVDGDGDGKCTAGNINDVFIQAFGRIPTDPKDPGKAAKEVSSGYRSYHLGVRVYRADAFKNSTSFTAGTAQTSFTGGTGVSKAQAPTVEMTTEIVVSDPEKFKKLCDGASLSGC